MFKPNEINLKSKLGSSSKYRWQSVLKTWQTFVGFATVAFVIEMYYVSRESQNIS